MKEPHEYFASLNQVYNQCYSDLCELITNLGGHWVADQYNPKRIVLRNYLGSPIIRELQVKGLVVYHKDAMYGSETNPFIYTEADDWKLLDYTDSVEVYSQLWGVLYQ